MPARIRVRVTPRGGRNAIDGFDNGGLLRVRVAAAPADGEANGALLRLLAQRAGVAPSSVRIVAGQRARVKTIEFDEVDEGALRARLSGEEAAS